MKNNPNAEFYASTSSIGPGYPVLHSNQFWCAGVINENQSLVVNLGKQFIVEFITLWETL